MRTQAVLEMAVRVLKRAREIISKPEHWTQKAFARDSFGRNLMVRDDGGDSAERIVTDKRAVCWCPDGAIRKALAEIRGQAQYRNVEPDEWETVQAHARMGLWDAFVALASQPPAIKPAEANRPTMWDWNDADEMTHEDVLAAFEVAIDSKEDAA